MLRWTAPDAGLASVTATFDGADAGGGTTTDVSVEHADLGSLFQGAVNGFGHGSAASWQGTVPVKRGAWIDFIVGYGNGSHAFDSTALDAVISFEPTQGPMPPWIRVQPTEQSVEVGTAIELRVVASGVEPLGYQWRLNGVDLKDSERVSGSGTSTLHIDPVAPTDAGTYTVVVSDAGGSVTSHPAVVSVRVDLPEITSQPIAQAVVSGSSATFTVSAAGSPPLSYQWRRNGVDLTDGERFSGARTPTLTIAAAEPGDLGWYRVEVSNPYGSTVSVPARLTVHVALPTITVQPMGQTVALGTTVSLQVQAAGSVPLHFRWRHEGVDLQDGDRISGAETSTLTISELRPGDLGDYSVVVRNSLGSAQSAPVTVATSSVALWIRRDGGQVVVQWTEPARGMRLQRTSSLAHPDWQDMAGSEGVSSVNVPIVDSEAAYFRLTPY